LNCLLYDQKIIHLFQLYYFLNYSPYI
jgi:hypothetical protein